MFKYFHVEVIKIIDGDTVQLLIDLGNKITWRDNFRLFGIDTPEKGTSGAAEATEYLRSLLANKIDNVVTFKPDKFGRWLAEIWVKVNGGALCVNRMMVLEKHAVEYFGGKKS